MRTFVKIKRGGENFWCEVLEGFGKDAVRCRVDNDIGDGLHRLSYGDVVIVKKSEVLDTMVGAK